MDDNRDGDSESEVDLTDLDAGPSTSRLHHLPSNSRQMRNEAEKKRRDTLNGYINELARLVPMVDGTPRRVDKISILRLAATYLMQNQILFTGISRQPQFFPSLLDTYNLSQSMIEDMDAFMLVVTTAGKIVFVSHTVERLLGHSQIDMFGQSLYNFTLKDDHPTLAANLTQDPDPDAPAPNVESPQEGDGPEMDETSLSASSDTSSSLPALSPSPLAELTTAEQGPPELQKRSFYLQLSQRSVSRTELPDYKRVHILGNLKIPRMLGTVAKPKTKRHREWPVGEGIGSGMETVLVAMVKLEHRIRELSLLEASKDEYVTRHQIDGRIIFSDHRIAIVAGYMAEDVSGMSAFKFMHPEDVMYTMVALRQMYDKGEGFGCSCYRLQCATGQFIYLRTHGYLEKSDATNQVESFICVNTLVCEKDGERLIHGMKARYSASIEAANQDNANEESITTTRTIVSSPSQLSEAISSLIPPIVHPVTHHVPFPDPQYMKAAMAGKSLPPAGLTISSPNRPSIMRPSVITLSSSSRRRRHDSTGSNSSKRRRPDETLTIQVPGYEELCSHAQSPSLSPASSCSAYSPLKCTPLERTRQSTGSPKPGHCVDRGDVALSPYRAKEPLSPKEEILSSPNQGSHITHLGYNEIILNSQATFKTSTQLSPNHTTCSYHTLLSSNLREYNPQNYKELVIDPNKAYVGNKDPNQAGLLRTSDCPSPRYPNNLELSSPEERSYQCEPYWNEEAVKDDAESSQYHRLELEDMLNETSGDPEPVFSQLQSDLQVQNVLITSIQRDIEQVPQSQSFPLPLYTSLTKYKEEHKQHQLILKGLKQDLQKTLSERNTNV